MCVCVYVFYRSNCDDGGRPFSANDLAAGTSCTLQDSVYVYMYLIKVAVLAHGANSLVHFQYEIIAWKIFYIFFVCVCVH